MFTHAARPRRGARTKHTLLGAVAATALLTGLSPTPAGATPNTDVAQTRRAQAEVPSVRIQNYESKYCLYRRDERVLAGPCNPHAMAHHWALGSDNTLKNVADSRQCLGDWEGGFGSFLCNGNHTKWTRYSDGSVKNWGTKKCLTMDPATRAPHTSACNHTDIQRWAFKS
ncbi:ricin-type beta-trefoil lectin domain protein [Streptomyces telluris]|uniref:ricin-type beta-trefoil lectin domain protein n=2 Tax=Streptomyces telluris TaxID=2720021 RepID=UPI003558612A